MRWRSGPLNARGDGKVGRPGDAGPAPVKPDQAFVMTVMPSRPIWSSTYSTPAAAQAAPRPRRSHGRRARCRSRRRRTARSRHRCQDRRPRAATPPLSSRKASATRFAIGSTVDDPRERSRRSGRWSRRPRHRCLRMPPWSRPGGPQEGRRSRPPRPSCSRRSGTGRRRPPARASPRAWPCSRRCTAAATAGSSRRRWCRPSGSTQVPSSPAISQLAHARHPRPRRTRSRPSQASCRHPSTPSTMALSSGLEV